MNKKELLPKIKTEMEERLLRMEIDIRTAKRIGFNSLNPQAKALAQQSLRELEIMKNNVLTTLEVIDDMIKEEKGLAKIDLKTEAKVVLPSPDEVKK